MSETDWNPALYARFSDLRLRPARDMLMQVPSLPAGEICDLGCGAGAVGPLLRARFADRRLVGIDASPAMLGRAAETGAYDALYEADAATWRPDAPTALIFSNALFNWIPDHAAQFARLAGALVPGGMLAVQMPRQFNAPSHALLRQIADAHFPDRFDHSDWQPPVHDMPAYAAMLAPLGRADIWEVEYLQTLPPADQGHPVRLFTQSTIMRPFTEALSDTEHARLLAAYEAALEKAYPRQAGGRVLFPFRRLFFTLTV